MTTAQTPDEALLFLQIASKDRVALAALYDRYARPVYAIAYRILGSVEDAEEVVLDVFCQVWRTAAQFDAKKGRADTWLFTIARSRALDRLRRLGRVSRVTDACKEAAMTSPIAAPEEDMMLVERRALVLAALAQLPEEQRRALELAYYQGMTHAEIAAATGKSLGTIKTRIRLGLSKLRDALKSDAEGL